MAPLEKKRTFIDSAALLALTFLVLLALHLPLLKLSYFWDEAGYYVPAAHDLFLTGSLIPKTTISNAHPPLVMAYLALWWKIFGFSAIVTRSAMLMMSSFAVLGLFRLAQRVANTQVAAASILCTAIYPVFFAQSSLVHLDLAAAGFTFWGLKAYVENRRIWIAIWFSIAVLTKETAILAPIGLAAWEVIQFLCGDGACPVSLEESKENRDTRGKPRLHTVVGALIIPAIPLAFWYSYHYLKTGFTFGNPEFLRYNVQATMHPFRIVLALLMRLWQTFGYMNLLLLTAAGILAMWRQPLRDQQNERPRITLNVQFAFLAVVAVYVIAMAVIGGAVLARYMLPVVPLVIVVFVSTLWRRIEQWRWLIAVVILGFVAGLFINPPYTFAPEDNLAYRDFIRLHQDAEHFLESHYPRSTVLTAWPASDELTRPFLGYVSRPLHILRIEDFRIEQLMSASDAQGYDVAFVFSTKYEPPNPLLKDWPAWERIKIRFFDYHHDVPPSVAAQILGGEIVFSEQAKGQWVAIIEMKQIVEAQNTH